MCGIQKSSKIPDRSVHEVGLVDGPYLFPTQPTASNAVDCSFVKTGNNNGVKSFSFRSERAFDVSSGAFASLSHPSQLIAASSLLGAISTCLVMVYVAKYVLVQLVHVFATSKALKTPRNRLVALPFHLKVTILYVFLLMFNVVAAGMQFGVNGGAAAGMVVGIHAGGETIFHAMVLVGATAVLQQFKDRYIPGWRNVTHDPLTIHCLHKRS